MTVAIFPIYVLQRKEVVAMSQATQDEFDAIVIGSGINALVASAMFARKGWRVLICERNAQIGGAIRTSHDTFDGYTVELLSSWHPLFVGGPAYALLADELSARGVEYLNTTIPTGVASAHGNAILSTDPAVTAETLGAWGDAHAWAETMAEFGSKADLAFGLLGTDFWRARSTGFAWKAMRKLGRRGLVASGAELLEPATPWLDRTFSSPVTRALFAPWALHNGLGPDDAASAFITKVIAAALAMGGMPVPRGGGVVLVDALASMVRDAGGEVWTDADVMRIDVHKGVAHGVTLRDGRTVRARRSVLASTTPQALYLNLLQGSGVSTERINAAEAFRFGRAGMQIHLALSEPPRWADPQLASAAMVHVLDSVDSLAESVTAANHGMLPRRPTIAVGQPLTVDPSRAPQGQGLLWIQLQENPRHPHGDSAGQLPAHGQWSDDLRDAYADRVISQLEPHITNIRSAATGRVVLGPHDLAAMNANLVGGDPYAGDCRVDQYAAWRPLSTATGHRTGVDRLWHIGASTHPGPGLGGGSGFLVASRLLG